jgi:diacylglycerol kinase
MEMRQTAGVGLCIPFEDRSSIASVWMRFRCAIAGISTLVGTEVNAKIHLTATVAVLVSGFWLDVSASDWCWLVVAVTLVWTAEALNTAVELLGDATSGGAHHTLVGKAKDVAAAGVLVSAMGAAVIGVIILWPRLSDHFARR